MGNLAADGVGWTRAPDGVVAKTAAGRLLPGVHRCLLRVETSRRPKAGPRLRPPTTKMTTATALLVLADQGRRQLDDPTGRHLPSDLVDRFRDNTGRAYAVR